MIFYSKGNSFLDVVERCGIPVVLQEYKIKETAPLKTLLYCSNCKWQLHVLATELPSSGCICQKYENEMVYL